MRVARWRTATLIEPLYICALTVVWVAPLAASVLTPLGRGDIVPLTLVIVVAIGAIVGAAALPSSYFRIHGFEHGGALYRRVGVRWLRKVAPYGIWTQRVVSMLGGRSTNSLWLRRSPLIGIAQTRVNERVHVAAVIVAIGGALQVLGTSHVGHGAYLLLVGCVSALCLCLQRYNRARLERIADRFPCPSD